MTVIEWPAWGLCVRTRSESNDDYFERLAWLYGEPYERIKTNEMDVAKWRRLGQQEERAQ